MWRSQKEAGTSHQPITTMAANSKSIAEELLEAISYQQMRAHPAYISESDAVTYRDFAQMELSSRYVLDTINCIGLVEPTPTMCLTFFRNTSVMAIQVKPDLI